MHRVVDAFKLHHSQLTVEVFDLGEIRLSLLTIDVPAVGIHIADCVSFDVKWSKLNSLLFGGELQFQKRYKLILMIFKNFKAPL